MNIEDALEIAKSTAKKASGIILKIYKSDDYGVRYKGKDDPVGKADIEANKIICSELHKYFPEMGILTEEAWEDAPDSLKKAMKDWHKKDYCWIIDPIDGTKGFIAKNDEFGIHIGLAHRGKAVLGVNYYPVRETMYWAIKGKGAYKGIGNALRVSNEKDLEKTRIISSHSNPKETFDKIINKLNAKKGLLVGSTGLKMMLVAKGEAEAHLKLRRGIYYWDTCSADIIISEAGGIVTDLEGKQFDYSDNTNLRLRGMLASNNQNHRKILEVYKEISETKKREEKNKTR